MNLRIKEIRKDNKMTQAEFGAKIGIKANTVTNYELGMRNPSDAIIFSICREFNVNENWLRYGTEPKYNKTPLDYSEICMRLGVTDEKAKRAIVEYFKLSDEDKELFWRFVDRFITKKDGKV